MDDIIKGEQKVAIHQANFLPWIGYFYKISKSDQFVFLDHVQYSKGSFTARVKIHQARDEQWLTIPRKKHGLDVLLKDIKIDRSKDFKQKFLKRFRQEYQKYPHFTETFEWLEKGFELFKNTDLLNHYNESWIKYICDYIGLKNNFSRSSDFFLNQESEQEVLKICQLMRAKTYLSGIGAKKYMDVEAFKAKQIDISYVEFLTDKSDIIKTIPKDMYYKSIVSWLMLLGPKQVNEILFQSLYKPAICIR